MEQARLRALAWLPWLLVIAVIVVLPAIVGNSFRVSLVVTIGIYAILALMTNLLFGYTGLLALGQNAFFALAPYIFAIAQLRFSLPSELALIVSLAGCAAIALILGYPVLRLRTHYFAMATLAFGMIVYALGLRWYTVTGGSAGLPLPPLRLFSVNLDSQLYYVTAVIALGTFVMCQFLIRSKVGRILRAIRDDEVATQTLGINTTYYKIMAFVLASVFSGVAGILFAALNSQVTPSFAAIHMVLVMLIMVIVGGIASNYGAVIGAIFVVLLPHVLAGIDQYQLFAFGIIILLLLIFEPRGIAGLIDTARGRFQRALGGRRGTAAEGSRGGGSEQPEALPERAAGGQ